MPLRRLAGILCLSAALVAPSAPGSASTGRGDVPGRGPGAESALEGVPGRWRPTGTAACAPTRAGLGATTRLRPRGVGIDGFEVDQHLRVSRAHRLGHDADWASDHEPVRVTIRP